MDGVSPTDCFVEDSHVFSIFSPFSFSFCFPFLSLFLLLNCVDAVSEILMSIGPKR